MENTSHLAGEACQQPLQKLDESGTLAAIKKYLRPSEFFKLRFFDPQSRRMVDIGRPDLSVFRFALRPEWAELFHEHEREYARKMLERSKLPSEEALWWLDSQKEDLEPGLDDDELEHVARLREEAGRLVDGLFSSRFRFAKPQETHDKVNDFLLERALNERFTRQLLQRVPKNVERLSKRSPLIPDRKVPDDVQIPLEESTRCYVFGLWDASVALARAALDQGLRDCFPPGANDHDLCDLIDAAHQHQVLDGLHRDWAHEIRRKGSDVLHEAIPADEAVAECILDKTRGVLRFLYARQGTLRLPLES